MQGRDSWLALQRHLAAARAAAERGDRTLALAEVDAALAIDPDFLAAQTLRHRMLNPPQRSEPQPAAPPEQDISAAPPMPRDVSPASYAKFQQRAKERRLETRVAAARAAIRERRLHDAAAALDEVNELDPHYPQLPALTGEFDALRRRTATSHRGPIAAAAAAFIATTLAASYVQESSSLISHPVLTAGVLMPATAPTLLANAETRSVGTSGEAAPIAQPASATSVPSATSGPTVVERAAMQTLPVVVAAAPAMARITPPAEPVSLNLPAPALPPAPAPPSAAPLRAEPAAAPAAAAVSTAPPPAPTRTEPVVEDSALVQNALRRYRDAYESLDARSAQAVWPAVNEMALARAFNGLESQRLVFDACDVRVAGAAATATCRGSARYVPKVGSREPRVEPRVWNFTLRKNGADWTIDTARAER